jgi:hypothetical protein
MYYPKFTCDIVIRRGVLLIPLGKESINKKNLKNYFGDNKIKMKKCFYKIKRFRKRVERFTSFIYSLKIYNIFNRKIFSCFGLREGKKII